MFVTTKIIKCKDLNRGQMKILVSIFNFDSQLRFIASNPFSQYFFSTLFRLWVCSTHLYYIEYCSSHEDNFSVLPSWIFTPKSRWRSILQTSDWMSGRQTWLGQSCLADIQSEVCKIVLLLNLIINKKHLCFHWE